MQQQLLFILLTIFSSIIYAESNSDAGPVSTEILLAEESSSNSLAPEIIPFTANYTTEWKVGWFNIEIDATRRLKKVSDKRWQILFEAAAGAAKLRETSEFTLSEQSRIQPLNYQYRASGLFNEDDRTLRFLPSSKAVLDQEKSHTHQQVWQDEIQDNLTYMLQAGLDLAAGENSFEYPVFEKNKSKPFRFEVVGEETLITKAGKLKTVKVKQVRKKKGRDIYAWFAVDKNYLLVRLLDKKNGKKRYEINVTDIQM